jgi:hypothetical protein
LADKKNYSEVEISALISKDKFVSLKDGDSSVIFNVTDNQSSVEITNLQLVPENSSELQNVAKVVIEAFDKKSNTQKKVVFQPLVPDASNPFPAPTILSNLMLLKPLQGLNTNQISLTVSKIAKTKLAVRLSIKACTNVTTTPQFTSKLACISQ